MPRSHFTTFVLLASLACRGSDPQPLEFLWGETLNTGDSFVKGGGASEFVGYRREDGMVRFLRQDPADPDRIEVVGDSSPVWGEALTFSGAMAAVGNLWSVTTVDLSSPTLEASTFDIGATPEALAMSGRWLLVLAGGTLTLIDLSVPSSRWQHVVASPVSSLVGLDGAFLAFTADGYVSVLPEGVPPSFVETEDPVIRGFRSAFRDGNEAVVAGPAQFAGRSRVVRLDVHTPGAPRVLRSHEVDGPFAFFAWDGGSTSVVAISGEYGMTVRYGYVVREVDGSFTSFGIPLPERYKAGNAIAAHAGHLFVLGNYTLGFYAIR